jgi:enoyl-CoA hydratase
VTGLAPNGTLEIIERENSIEARIMRPEVRNAINADVLADLSSVLDELEARPRFLIITGGVGLFASGADLNDLRARRAGDALRAPNVRVFERLERSPLPTIAAIDGYAFGGGAELAMACDFRISTTAARFGQPEGTLGLIPGAGGTWRLRRLVGLGMARQIALAGRVLSGGEALAAGLVDEVVDDVADLMPAARDLIARMARSTEMSLRLMKIALNSPDSAHPEIDLIAQGLLFEYGEKNERIDAFLESRADRAEPLQER